MPKITFVDAHGQKTETDAPVGATMLSVAHNNDVPIEGACGGSLACATCHVVLDKNDFAKNPVKSEEEEDMLDLAFGLTPTSRLCCQIEITDDMDGMIVQLPED